MGRGAETRAAIVDHAVKLASTVGLEALTIGSLAKALDLSKSGLFAHFRSKENLQITVIDAAADLFVESVIRPAVAEPRGEPRIRAFFERWLRWAESERLPGGCLFVAAAAEVDDRPGPVRDSVAERQREWLGTLAKAARLAIEQAHFRSDLDPQQFGFEMYAIMLGHHHATRLLRDPSATERAKLAFTALLQRSRPLGVASDRPAPCNVAATPVTTPL